MSIDTLHTQATNFMDFIKTGVDARTGQFTLAFQLPLIPANNLAGPALSPTLSFSVLGSTRDRGYGLGWSLDLSEINLHQDAPSLRLSSGESFAIDIDSSDLSPGSEVVLFDAKLKSMVVTYQSDTVFRIDHKTGQTEFLTQQDDSSRYLVSEIRSPEGRRLFIEWASFANEDFILERIRDEYSTLLQVQSDEGEVRFVVPGAQAKTTVRLQMANDTLSDVYLPGIETPFSIIYDHHVLNESNHLLLPTSFTSPLGASDAVTWGTGDEGHQLPEGAPFEVLPRVVEWKHMAGTPDTELTRTYEWSSVHNFLGYGSDQAFDWKQGRDNLYEVEQDYDYEVVETQTNPEGKTLSTITRTWNRFHLLTSEVVKRGVCEVHNLTTFGIEADTDWVDQPAWCQLPHQQTVTYIDGASGTQRSETTQYRYDESGNVSFTRSPAGVEEHNEYYPAEGAEGCPSNALGMVRYLKKKTVKPARLADGTYGGASEVSTAYTYTSLPSLIEGEPALVLVENETTRDDTHARVMETTSQTYVTEGDGYARVARTVVKLNGKATTTSYRYELTLDELSTHVTVTGFEDTSLVRQSQDSARSLSSGQMTRDRTLAGVLSRYEYDDLGRVSLAVTADDSRYRATRKTTYHVNDKIALAQRTGAENPVMIEHTHATGQRRRQWLDGEGRTVRVELEDIDYAPGVFREIIHTVFDVEGRVVRDTHTDWLREENDPASATALSLTTTTEYDDWGQTCCVTTPDGVQAFTEHNPAKLTLKQWQGNGDLKGPSKLSLFNAAGSVIQEQLYDTDDTLVRTTQWTRDGLDRVYETRMLAEGEDDRVTRQHLDFYGRPLEQTLPDGTVINWTYAQHSDDNHPESVAVTASES